MIETLLARGADRLLAYHVKHWPDARTRPDGFGSIQCVTLDDFITYTRICIMHVLLQDGDPMLFKSLHLVTEEGEIVGRIEVSHRHRAPNNAPPPPLPSTIPPPPDDDD